MAWTDGVDYSTGQLISASIWNNYLGAAGNIDLTAPGVVTTAGDTVYATGDNTLARLAKGTARQNLTMNSGASAPEWTASPASTLTAKGDILAASAANTIARLAVGSNDTILTADSSESTGIKWAAAAGGGKILQVVVDYGSVQYSTTSSTLQTIDDPVVSITPANSSNKILILGGIVGYNPAGDMFIIDLQRAISGGATTSGLSGENHGMGFIEASAQITVQQTVTHLDSPSTTSACTYKMMFSNQDNSSTVYAGMNTCGATLIALEVDGT